MKRRSLRSNAPYSEPWCRPIKGDRKRQLARWERRVGKRETTEAARATTEDTDA